VKVPAPELTQTQECLEELGAPELLQEIAAGGHWSVDRIKDAADWCNLAQMASIGLIVCTNFGESQWMVTPKGRRALKEWSGT